MAKERLNIIKEESGAYCAHLVNLPICIQGKTIEDVKEQAAACAKMWIEQLQETFAQEDPFEIKEFFDSTTYLKGY